MSAIKATVKSGQLELQSPLEWPDGTEVLIEPTMTRAEKTFGIDESQWSNDPDSLADWAAWIKTIEPLEFTSGEAEKMAEFDERMRLYNIEAVCRQMREWNSE